ncbi:DUF3152 domain-containing protein [Paractinoplanes brasiliensis]|uniref:Uncharacterized protein DUF3152 n=1 Tax=Paractinoplanes brasiliensis TaxID=52695 RepID=A0A4R6JR35_9ACTN|nr:DUF3152 domain-containing protein [Actinoplanes brasiliensis]TDO38859.1 uncharacterized protein DUF3152 [Actinoplanes brasiliensis]GID26363.1 hypothetical protein Abr02nite_13460 [Actinoplanes brasiliensis]
MIDEVTAPPATPPTAGQDRWRQWWLATFALVILVGGGFAVGRRIEQGNNAAPPVVPSPSAASTPPEPSPSPTPTPSKTPAKIILQMPGPVPARGSGQFTYAASRGPVFGSKGQLRRFRVAVEKGSNENAEDFATQVAGTLGDPRGWTGSGRVRLQLVSGSDAADFTVYLATRETTGKLCLRGGTNVSVGGRPYTSCRTIGKAIINLDRWRLSATPFVSAKVPLSTYRQYVVNHEVGHELGHRHEGCPRAGGPAPVMVQQTLTLRGCKAYAWPRWNGKMLSGPRL